MNVRLKIVKELAKFEERTSFYIKDYYGSKNQIKNEIEIINELDKILIFFKTLILYMFVPLKYFILFVKKMLIA